MDKHDAHLPYVHFFSFNFLVEILKNQATTLLRNLFYKKCDMHVKNSQFFTWRPTQPMGPALGTETIKSHVGQNQGTRSFTPRGRGDSNDYISYTLNAVMATVHFCHWKVPCLLLRQGPIQRSDILTIVISSEVRKMK